MKRQDYRFFHRLRVRWAEVDMQKIVFNAHYLMYFDTAVADYWRALALPYEEAMHALGGDLYVKKASVEYHGSARYDDQIDIGLKCARIGTSSMVFSGAIFRGDVLLISCELIYVFADPATQTSRPVPDGLRKILTGFEAGEPMVTIRTGSWSELGEHAGAIRTAVFVEEQGIPLEMEWDEADQTAVHVVAYNGLGQAIGTGRLLQHAPGSGKIGRMAVNRVLRGSSLGRELLKALMAHAEQRGDSEVLLHAQRSAEGFYARLGFAPRGEPFEEAGIPHIEMVRTIGAKR
ncbi:MAG: YbgC/FadM family acyl-CoA thioesterase [Polaromonas sp.]|uniref:YbgC/FadM family acyl-CoA thioesterase n=1 Tax=Polaromonas sp. TaxID=1869339 RepID=UPI004035D813